MSKQVIKEALPQEDDEKVQSVSSHEGKMLAKEQGYKKRKIALIAVVAFLVVGGIVGGLVYYFLEEIPVKHQEGRLQEFQTTGRECLVVVHENTNESNKTEQCTNKTVYSQLVTMRVTNTSVTKVLVIEKIEYQLDNGTNFTLPGINFNNFNRTMMRFLQQNDDSQNATGDINQAPNAVIISDKNDSVQSVGFPNNTDPTYRTSILQQIYNVQINPTDNPGLTNLGNLNASTDTPNRRVRILQDDGNTNQGQGPIVNASQQASIDANGNVNQSNITQSQQITSQNPDNSTTTISGNSSSTLTCTQQSQASNDTLNGIQKLTAQQNITYYSAENISQAILPAYNQANNNQTTSQQDSQNPADQTNQESNNQGPSNQPSQDSNNQTLSQQGGVDGNSSNRLLVTTTQPITLAQFSKSLISTNFLGISFNAMNEASAKLTGSTLILDYNNYCTVNNRYIVLVHESYSIATGARPISKSFRRDINQNLFNQVYLVFGYPIFLSVNSQISYGYTLSMTSPTQTQLLATIRPYANYQLNAQAYTTFVLIDVGIQATGDLAKISASFTINANLVAKKSTATAVATISQNLNINGYYDYIACRIHWARACFGRRWWRICFSYPYVTCTKSATNYVFNTNLFSDCKSVTLYSKTSSW